MGDFKKDLERGAYYEIKALDILKQHKFKKLKRIEGYFKEYDIKAMYKNKKVFIECKYNRYTSYTNKFFIECFKCDYLTDYIKSNGIYTKYTVGVLVDIDIINKYILFKGEHKKRL